MTKSQELSNTTNRFLLREVTVKAAANVKSDTADDPYVATLFKNISGHVMSVGRNETIFSQGDRADSVYFIQSGRVKISVVSYAGREGVLAIIGPRGFFGAESLTATATEPSMVLQIEKSAMVRAL